MTKIKWDPADLQMFFLTILLETYRGISLVPTTSIKKDLKNHAIKYRAKYQKIWDAFRTLINIEPMFYFIYDCLKKGDSSTAARKKLIDYLSLEEKDDMSDVFLAVEFLTLQSKTKNWKEFIEELDSDYFDKKFYKKTRGVKEVTRNFLGRSGLGGEATHRLYRKLISRTVAFDLLEKWFEFEMTYVFRFPDNVKKQIMAILKDNRKEINSKSLKVSKDNGDYYGNKSRERIAKGIWP